MPAAEIKTSRREKKKALLPSPFLERKGKAGEKCGDGRVSGSTQRVDGGITNGFLTLRTRL